METKVATKPAAIEVVSKLSLGALTDGLYLIGRVAVPTEGRTWSKDGKSGVMFVTTLYADGGLYEYVQFGDTMDAKETDRKDPIQKLQIGQRVLFRRNPPMRNKQSGRTEVEKLFGKVLDVQGN